MWDVLCPRRKQAVLVLNGQLIPFCSACVPVIRSCGKQVSLAGEARTLGVFDSSGKLQRQKVLPEPRGAWARPHMASCWVALGRPLGFGHVPSHACCVPLSMVLCLPTQAWFLLEFKPYPCVAYFKGSLTTLWNTISHHLRSIPSTPK